MNHKYLTERERYQIEVLLKKKHTPKEISEMLDICLATVYNEIKRGEVELMNSDLTMRKEYCADYAQMMYEKRQKNKGAEYKALHDEELLSFITEMIINKHFSPYAVIQYIKKNQLKFSVSLCEKTIYNYIYCHLLFIKKEYMPMPRKGSGKRSERSKTALNNISGKSIDERPKSLESRDKFGDWEIDTVYSGQCCKSKECLLVLTERTTREEEIYRMKARTQAETVRILNEIEIRLGKDAFRERYRTITCDNGVEFLDYENITSSVFGGKRTELFYCHPYSSYERGSNENINKLIRRFIPKGSDISKYSDDYILYIIEWINNYPRRIFGGLSSLEYGRKIRAHELCKA